MLIILSLESVQLAKYEKALGQCLSPGDSIYFVDIHWLMAVCLSYVLHCCLKIGKYRNVRTTGSILYKARNI